MHPDHDPGNLHKQILLSFIKVANAPADTVLQLQGKIQWEANVWGPPVSVTLAPSAAAVSPTTPCTNGRPRHAMIGYHNLIESASKQKFCTQCLKRNLEVGSARSTQYLRGASVHPPQLEEPHIGNVRGGAHELCCCVESAQHPAFAGRGLLVWIGRSTQFPQKAEPSLMRCELLHRYRTRCCGPTPRDVVTHYV